MIDLSSIEVSSLPSVALEDRAALPTFSAIYFALAESRVVYVGRASNLRRRWRNHHHVRDLEVMNLVRIAYIECDKEDLGQIEQMAIKFFAPRLNTAGLNKTPKPRGGAKAYIDISAYWPKDKKESPASVNSVWREILHTPLEMHRNTLRLALSGQLDRGHFSNQVKLARLVSGWAGKEVTILDLLKVVEDE